MPHRLQPHVLILLLALFAGPGALAQGKKPPAAETPLAQCAAANRQALLDLTQAAQASQRRHVVNPMVVTRLQSLQVQLGKLREALPRTSRSQAECEQASEAIAAEKDRLLKIAGPDTEAAECLANSQKLHSAVTQAYEAVQRSGRLPADQNAAFEASGARLNQMSAALARDSMLAADCRQLVEQIALERTRVESWMGLLGIAAAPAQAAPALAAAPAIAAAPAAPAASIPAPAPAPNPEQVQACRDSQARSYNELAQSLTVVAQGPPLAADKMAVLHALSDRLTRLRALLADRNAPGWDCDRVNRDLAQVRAELQPLLPTAR